MGRKSKYSVRPGGLRMMWKSLASVAVFSVVFGVGGSGSAVADDGRARRSSEGRITGPTKITVKTTTIRRDDLGQTVRSVASEVVRADGRGRSRLDRGDLTVVRDGFQAPKVVLRETGDVLDFSEAPKPSDPGKVIVTPPSATEDLGERVIGGERARGTLVTYEVPNPVQEGGAAWKVQTETWKADDGRILMKTTSNSGTETTTITEYSYQPLRVEDVPEELFEVDSK